jgi:hypothetical protein
MLMARGRKLNEGLKRIHPCQECEEDKEYCFLQCPWNEGWTLRNPCEDCAVSDEEECDDDCPFHARLQELETGEEVVQG